MPYYNDDEAQVQGYLQEMLQMAEEIHDELGGKEFGREIVNVYTYEEAMMMTGNAGIVFRTRDGKEFQLTIHQSRRGRS